MATSGTTETSGSETTQHTTVTSPVINLQSTEYFNPADDPLFVGHNENIGASLVSSKLTNADNFIPWRSSMMRSLSIKAKLGFVQGHFPKPTDDPYKLARWERCNGVILSWIINSVSDEIAASLVHSVSCVQAWNDLQIRFGGDKSMREYSISKEISLLMQGELSVSSYFNKLLHLWGDEDCYEETLLCELGDKCKSTKCMKDKKLKTRIQKFLMGLNDIHSQVRTQILSTRPRLSLDESYSLVLDDEMTKMITKPTVMEASALYTSYNSQNERQTTNSSDRSQSNDRQFNNRNYSSGTSQGNTRARRPLLCSHCQMQGHLKETCYKLNGYPPGHRLYRGTSSQSYKGNKHSANNVTAVPSATGTNGNSTVESKVPGDSDGISSSSNQMSQVHEQLTKLLSLFNPQERKDEKQFYMAGISCLATTKVPHDTWILDSGATDHITPHMHLLYDLKLLHIPYEVLMPNGSKALVTHTGSCAINQHLTICDVLLVPEFQFNLMSVGKLITNADYTVNFSDSLCTIQDKAKPITLATGDLNQGLFQIKSILQSTSLSAINTKDSLQLWHCRLGHASIKNIAENLSKHISLAPCNKADICCDICPMAKQTRLKFPISTTSSSHSFDLIHGDIGGPFHTPTFTGAKYFLTLVDDYSRTTWTFLLPDKHSATATILQFFRMVHNQFGQKIKVFRSDNGTEFFNNTVSQFLINEGCLHQSSCVYTPQQNGVVERKHRHLLEVARAIKFQATLPDFFWGDCVLTATYLINRLPSGLLGGKTPYELLFSQSPTYEHIRVFGCLCYASTIAASRRKFDARAEACIFVGYPHNQKGYKLFSLKNHTYLVSRDVVFHETRFPYSDTFKELPAAATIPLPQGVTSDQVFAPLLVPAAIAPETEIETSQFTELTDAPENIVDNNITEIQTHDTNVRKSTRVPKPSVRLKDFICGATTTKYPISHFVSYSKCSPQHKLYVFQTSCLPEPSSYAQACKDPMWQAAMEKELNALESNDTWTLTSLPPGKNPVSSKWIFRIKRHSDGSVERYKARLVARGFTQEEGLDYNETFAPVVKMPTVRTVLALAASKDWPLYQLDVDNAFLHGDLDEEVYMTLPPGFYKKEKQQGLICRLNKSLYGLKQAPRQWFSKFADALLSYGFIQSPNDHSLFTLAKGDDFIILLVYVDDIVLTGTSASLIQAIKAYIHSEFRIKDLGLLKYFLGIEVARSSDGIFINQRKYALDLLTEVGLLGCKPSSTPMDIKQKLAISNAPKLEDPTTYRKLVGKLIYLNVTRPDIAFSVHILSQFLAAPTVEHLQAAHRVLRFIKSAPAQGLFYPARASLTVEGFCDADWAACPVSRRSTSGYCIKLGPSLVSWRTRKQTVVSRSSAESEYRAMAQTSCELVWLVSLMRDLRISVSLPISLFCDNRAANHIARNPVFHERTKHIEIDCHVVRHHFSTGFISPQFVGSSEQPADLFTKALPADLLSRLSLKLGVSNFLHASLEGGY
ncbi:unnamed protein product [Rhodiola kirilowii]